MRIPILYEPIFESSSVWCRQMREEMEALVKARKYSFVKIDGNAYRTVDYDALFGDDPRLVLIVSTTQNWLCAALDFFDGRKIGTVVADCCPSVGNRVKGQVAFDYEKAVGTLLRYLSDACGCRRVALYGIFRDSSADGLKKATFLRERAAVCADPESLCFENGTGLADCYESFRERVSAFDGVICVNDIAAIHLVRRLREDGIRVPEEIQVVCFGSTKLSERSDPPITMLCLDFPAVGRHAVLTYRALYHASDDAVTANVKIAGDLIKRGSTIERAGAEPTAPTEAVPPASDVSDFYRDDEVIALSRLEKLLLICSETDRAIIRKLTENESVDRIAEDLYLSRSAVFYRIGRLEEAVGLQELHEFKAFLTEHHVDQIIGRI